jgi:hypothetical protein
MSTETSPKKSDPNLVPFVNQPHSHSHLAEQQKNGIENTYGLPETGPNERAHLPNELCHCGQYHTVLSQDADEFRLEYRNIMQQSATLDTIGLAIAVNQHLSKWNERNPNAFREITQSDMRRKLIGVKEEQIELVIENQKFKKEDEMKFFQAFSQTQNILTNSGMSQGISNAWEEEQRRQDRVREERKARIEAKEKAEREEKERHAQVG